MAETVDPDIGAVGTHHEAAFAAVIGPLVEVPVLIGFDGIRSG